MVGILNFGLGNIHSVANAFEYLGHSYKIIHSPQEISEVDKLVIPGVGHFKHGMESLLERGLSDEINDFALVRQKPVLGICLGMQLMAIESSEGGMSKGLGWFDCTVQKIPSKNLRVPVVGWVEVDTDTDVSNSALFKNINRPTFYFVHSFYVDGRSQYVSSKYGLDVCIAASIERDNIFGVQFHPEKSQQDGLQMLNNFMKV